MERGAGLGVGSGVQVMNFTSLRRRASVREGRREARADDTKVG